MASITTYGPKVFVEPCLCSYLQVLAGTERMADFCQFLFSESMKNENSTNDQINECAFSFKKSICV